jgi:hypothetical protein
MSVPSLPLRLPVWPPGPVWRRRGHLGVLVVGVAALPGVLIGPVSQPLGRQPSRSPAMRLVTLPSAAAPQPNEPPGAPAPESAEPPPLLAAPTPGTTTVTAADARPVDWAAGPQAPEAVSSTDTFEKERAAQAASGAADDDGGRRPPLYATTPADQPLKLNYRVERGDDAGTGQLSWEPQPDGRYRARFWGEAGGSALMDWLSRGSLAAAGLAPERMVERQRGVEVRAVNFQRDQGVISFSGSSRAVPLHPGAQDRVSVLWQLAAIAQAHPGGLPAGLQLRLQVAGTRGQAEEWRFEVTGIERLGLAGGALEAVHLVREPARPYDQRIELWLAPQAGHVPVGLRFTPVPGKASSAFWLQGDLPPAPAPRPGTP